METNEIIKELRKSYALTQTDLGNILNCDRFRIADIERGKTQPNIQDIKKLSQHFNVSADYLLGLSKNTSTDFDVIKICNYTGLSDTVVKDLRDISQSDKINKEKYGFSVGQIDLINLLFEKSFFNNICVSYCDLIRGKNKAEKHLKEMKELYAANYETYDYQALVKDEKAYFRYLKWEMFEELQRVFSSIIGDIHDEEEDENADD